MTESPTPIIVVLDTNALLPLLVGSTPRAKFLRQAWRARRFELFITPQTLAELKRVLTYPNVRQNYALTRADIDAVLDVLKSHARTLPGVYEGVTAVTSDESDNVFLAAAMEAGADYVVTQDPHLLNLKYHRGTQIISPAQFAQLL